MTFPRALLSTLLLVGCADATELGLAEATSTDADSTNAPVAVHRAELDESSSCGTDRPVADTTPIPPPGSNCEYVTTDGIALIESIEAAGPDDSRCDRDPVIVRFRFVASEPNPITGSPVTFTNGIYTIHGGMAPPRACITAASFQVGSRRPVKRHTQVRGSCSPVTYEFDDALDEACSAACFNRP